jgi:hypothetical protein
MPKKGKLTDKDRAFLEQVRINAERTRKLAEKAQAELDRQKAEQQHQSA